MKVHREILATDCYKGVSIEALRLWKDDSKGYGDPYDLFLVIKHYSDGTVEAIGQVVTITPDMWRAVKENLNKSGIRKILIVRYKNGKRIEKIVR